MESVVFPRHGPAAPRLCDGVPSSCQTTSTKSHLSFHHSSNASMNVGLHHHQLSWAKSNSRNFGSSIWNCKNSGADKNSFNDPNEGDNPRDYATALLKEALFKKDTGRLEYECNKTKKENAASAYELELALVEVLIRMGKYEEAWGCDCLKSPKKDGHAITSDRRSKVFKSFLSLILGHEDEDENGSKLPSHAPEP